MKRFVLRSATLMLLALAVGLVSLAGFFGFMNPVRTPPPDIRVERTPARLARGEYIFKLADCDGCHSQRDFSRFGGPVVAAGRGQGNVLPPELGLPGLVVAPNITPDVATGIGSWTDGEKLRAIRDGIDKDGRPLFPMMPYAFFRNLSDEDAYSLIAYLDSLPPVRNLLPGSDIDFPVSVLVRTAPQPAGRVPEPDRADPVKYGRYLATVGTCVECHTPADKGKPVAGMEFAGGRLFAFPGAQVVTANITPDLATGIGKWSERDFVDRFYQYRDYVRNGSPTVGPEGFSLMPWLNLCQLREEDLKAIFAYLRTQKPVYHSVETHPVPLS